MKLWNGPINLNSYRWLSYDNNNFKVEYEQYLQMNSEHEQYVSVEINSDTHDTHYVMLCILKTCQDAL